MSGFPKNTAHAKTISAITNPVEITNIIVSQWSGAGEFTDTNVNAFSALENRVTRMGDHLEFLAKIVNQEHENANFEQKGMPPIMVMKADALNKVTRLTLNEFSLYTKDTPLNENEYKALLNRVTEIAQDCHENLHLVIASVPLLGPDNQVHNIEMHVQCGEQPRLKCLAKFVPSPIDAVYPNTYNPSFIGKGVMPHFLDRQTRPDPGRSYLSFNQINNWIWNSFDAIKKGNTTPAPYNQIKAWLGHTCNELAQIKDPNYLPPQALVDCATQLLNSVNSANSPNKMKLLNADFVKFNNEMRAYKIDCDTKNTQFRNSVKNPVNIITNAPDEVHVDDFGKYKMAATTKTFAGIVQAAADCLNDPNKHSLAIDWLNEIQRNLLPGNVAVNRAIDDLKLKINGSNDPRVAPARAFKKDLDHVVGILQKKSLTTTEYDQLNVFKAQYQKLLEDQRNIFSATQKLTIDADVKPHFELVFNKVMHANMTNAFVADMDSLIKNYDKDPEYYAGMVELQRERLDALVKQHNITEPKVLDLIKQFDVILEKITLKTPVDNADFTLFATNKSELDIALDKMRFVNTITDGEIKAFVKAKDKMNEELNATILDGTVKTDATITDSLKQAVKDYQETDFIDKVVTELNSIREEWDSNNAKPEFLQRVGRLQKIVTNIQNALPEVDKPRVKPLLDKLSDHKKPGLVEITTFRLQLQAQVNKLNQLPYSTFPVGESQDISYDPIAKCKTAGGVWFDTAIQVCLDHAFDTVQASMKHNERLSSGSPSSPYVSHILTSNSMGLEAPRTFTEYVTHADIRGDTMGVVKIDATKTTKAIQSAVAFSANPSTMKPAKSALYTSTNVTADGTNPEHLWIENPPFGPQWCSMRKYPPHALSPMPLNNGSTVSQDSFANSYYVSKIQSVLASIPVLDDAVKQKQCLTDFSKALSTLKDQPNPSVQDFYNLLDNFREEIKKINDEDTSKMHHHIHSIEHYLDTIFLPPEPFITLRILNSLGNGLPPKQGAAVNDLNFELTFYQIFGTDLNDLTNANEFADKYFDFKKTVYSIDDEDITKIAAACKSIEANLEKHNPLIHEELKKLHEEYFKLGKSKLAEDYYQSQLNKISEANSAKQQVVDAANNLNGVAFNNDKATEANLKERVDKLLLSQLTFEQRGKANQLRLRVESISKKKSNEVEKGNASDSVSKITEDLAQFMATMSRDNFKGIFEKATKDHKELKDKIVEKRESIKTDELKIEQLKKQLPTLQEDVHLKQETFVLSSKLLEIEKNKLSQIQENKKEEEQALVKLRESCNGLTLDRDTKERGYKEEVKTLKEMQLQLQVLQDKQINLEQDKTRLLEVQGKLQQDKQSLEDKLIINKRQSLDINGKIEQAQNNLISNQKKIDVALQSANEHVDIISGLQNKASSLDKQCEKLTGDIADCHSQIKEYEERLKRLGPVNANNKEDFNRNTNQLEDFKKRLDMFQQEYQKFDSGCGDLRNNIHNYQLEHAALLSEADRLKEQNVLLTNEIKSLESKRESNQTERQSLLEQQPKVTEELSTLHNKLENAMNELERNGLETTQFSSKLMGQKEKVNSAEVQLNSAENKLQESLRGVEDAQGKFDKLILSEKLQLETVDTLGNRCGEQEKLANLAQQKLTNTEDEILQTERALPNKKSDLKVLTDKMESVDSNYRELQSQQDRQEEVQKELAGKSALAEKAIKEELKPKLEQVEELRSRFGNK